MILISLLFGIIQVDRKKKKNNPLPNLLSYGGQSQFECISYKQSVYLLSNPFLNSCHITMIVGDTKERVKNDAIAGF